MPSAKQRTLAAIRCDDEYLLELEVGGEYGRLDQVIQLEATANNGRIGQAGAIEDAAVRDAIMQTVDGGTEAFRLRHMKYGF